MELPNDAPRLPKLLFLLSDVVLLAIAAFLAYQAGSPPSTATIVGIIVCAGLGVAIGIAPFIIDYARAQDQQLTERQSALEALVRTTSSAADQASIAANGLNEIASLTKQNLASVEALPQTIAAAREEALAKSAEAKETGLESLRDELAALRQQLQDIPQSPAEPTPDPATAKTLAKLQAGLTQLTDQLAAVQSTLQELAERPVPVAAPASPAEIASPPPSTPAEDSAPEGEPEPAKSDTPALEKPKAKAKAKPKPKPKPKKPSPPPEPSLFDAPAEEPAAQVEPDREPEQESPAPAASLGTLTPETDAGAETVYESVDDDVPDVVEEASAVSTESPKDSGASAEDTTTPSDEEPPAESDEDEPKPIETLDEPAPVEPSLSSDGKTRLTVTAYLGIGNRLFVRGEGPGLSPDEGTPLQFVSIGKWRWETDAASGPVKLTLWKNDQQPCTTSGEIELQPGAQFETSATF